jgi:transmembrane sensor
MDERVWVLLAKRKAGEATPAELAELDALLNDSRNSHLHNEVVDRIWLAPLRSLPEMKPGKAVWNKVAGRMHEPAPKVRGIRRSIRWLSAAAVAAAIAGSIFYISTQHHNRQQEKIATAPAGKKQLVLPDGTQVWLNGNSDLTYNKAAFGRRNREVQLIGEAFFDVAKDATHPFIIHAANVNIRVMGTAFNVKAYPAQKQVETSLIRGLVEVTTQQDPERKILLKPNEKITINAALEAAKSIRRPDEKPATSLFTITRLQKDEQNVLPETVWMNAYLSFDNEPLMQLAPKLESWFSVTVHVEDSVLTTKRFSGMIKDETLQQTLEAMKLSYPFSYTIEQGEVWIKR